MKDQPRGLMRVLSSIVLGLSALALISSILLYWTREGALTVARRSSLVAVARAEGVYVCTFAGILVGAAIVLQKRPRLPSLWAIWMICFLWWCGLGRTLKVYPDTGTVKGMWFIVETESVFSTDDEQASLPGAEALGDDPETMRANTQVDYKGGWITFSYKNGRSSSIFVGPIIARRSLDLLAFCGFVVDGYQDPTCLFSRGSCPGRPIPPHVPFLL